jgi:hypothetical protein
MLNFEILSKIEQYLYANYLYLRLVLSLRVFKRPCLEGKLILILKRNDKFWKDKSLYYNFINFLNKEKDFILEMLKKELLLKRKININLSPYEIVCLRMKDSEFKLMEKIDFFQFIFEKISEPNIDKENLPSNDDFEKFIIKYNLYNPKERIPLSLNYFN